MMQNKHKVILHSINSDFWERNPFYIYKMQRGILVADEGDIVITPVPYEEDYVRYLKNINILSDGVTLWNPRKHVINNDIAENFFKDQELINYLNQHRKTHYIDISLPSFWEKELAEKIGLEVFYNFETGKSFSSKANFRGLIKSLNLPILRGFEFLKSPYDIKNAVFELFNNGIETVIIKNNYGHSGLGNFKVEKSHFNSLTEYDKAVFIRTIFENLGPSHDFIVEEFLNNRLLSPSFQYRSYNGSYNLIAVHDQIFATDRYKRELYTGVKYSPLYKDNILLRDATRDLSKVMQTLVSVHKYAGYSGFDLVVQQDGLSFIIDPNLRWVISLYPHLVARKILSSDHHYINYNYLLPSSLFRRFKDIYKLLGQNSFPIKDDARGIIILAFYPYDKLRNCASILFSDYNDEGTMALKNTFELNLSRFLLIDTTNF